ncbi:MAG TPA: S1C family serine protease [Rectinemataceae bacterium]|nr:S1C family serine protease [Rectinemataceae bacterium]
MDDLASLSASLAALAAAASPRLFHVPSSLGGRTALGFDGKHLLVPAYQAEEGDRLEILAAGGERISAEVVGFDPKLSLAVLELEAERPASAFTPMDGLPALGSLVLALAYPSPQGPEARLDLIRFSGGEGEDAYIQTDGGRFPGFAGAALVAPDGSLAGFVVSDGGGNRGWALSARRAARLAASIAERGFASGAWLGVSTVPVEAPEGFASLFGDGREEALMVANVQTGGPAALAGLLPGDLVVSLGGKAARSPAELLAILDEAVPDAELELVLVRGGQRLELRVRPSARPKDVHRGEHRRDGDGSRGRAWWHRGGRPWGCAPGR